MNAQRSKVKRPKPFEKFTFPELQALAANPAPMPDTITDGEINQMAQWYAETQWGNIAVGSDSQEWGF